MPSPRAAFRYRAVPILVCLVLGSLLFDPMPATAAEHNEESVSLLPAEAPLGALKRARRSGFRRSRNTHGSHYFLGTSAIPLPKGDGWYKNTMVSLNSAQVGLTQHLAIGGSVDLVSVVSAKENGPVWSTRMQVSGSLSDNAHLGACAFYLRTQLPTGPETGAFNSERPPGFGAVMGMFTLGNPDYQLTVAGGITYDGKNTGRGPLIHVGALARLFPNVAIMTEHWVVSDPARSFFVHSLGARVIGENLAIDAGLAYDKELLSKVTPVGLPFLSATLNF